MGATSAPNPDYATGISDKRLACIRVRITK